MMEKRKEKSIRVKLTGDDVDRFAAAKAKAERETGIKMTDTSFLGGAVKLKILAPATEH